MTKNYLKLFFNSIISILVGLIFSVSLFGQTNYGWLQRSGFPGPARHRGTAAAVGNRGYVGLGHINSVFDILFDDWFEYDPGSDSWTQKASFPGGPRMHATSFTIGNKIYTGTGRDVNQVLYNDFYSYDPSTNTWSNIAPFPGAARRGAVSFVINGIGYVGTGSYHSNFYKYDPAIDVWSPVTSLPGTGRISAVAFSINGKGYLTTGDDGGPNTDMWEYDPTFDSWTAKANLPGLPRMEACGFALNGKGFVGTGDDFSSGTNYQDFWSYDPTANTWIQVADFSGQARRYMSSFIIGNRAYTCLGTSGINYADLWEYGSISGIDENTNGELSISVFPNPIHENAILNFSENIQQGELILTDITGKQIQKISNINGYTFQFNRNEISSGIYCITLLQSNKIISRTKILID